MNIWLVSPAWQRYEVTKLVLAQRRWLCDTLAARGLTANCVIVADDENLDVAEEFGFPTVEHDNTDLGSRFNAGYSFAAGQGADVFVHIGSDDWLHPDAFNVLDGLDLQLGEDLEPERGEAIVWSPGPVVVAQRRLLLVDLARQLGQRCYVENYWGCIPWIIPRSALERTGFKPIERGLMRGIDGALARGLGNNVNWIFQDAPDEWLVDWKTEWNVTAYNGLSKTLGIGDEEEARPMLEDFYPVPLVDYALAQA